VSAAPGPGNRSSRRPRSPGEEDAFERELLAGPVIIHNVLGRLAEARALVEVHPEGSPQRFQSALLALRHDPRELWLDELIPRDPARSIRPGSRWWVRGRHAGVPFSFAATLLGVELEDAIPLYRLTVPERMRYAQRRAAFRAPVPTPLSLAARLVAVNDGHRLRGLLRDLSAGGCGLRVEAARLDPRLGETRCSLELPDENRVRFVLEPRHVELVRPGEWLIGGRYVDLGRRERRVIERLVARLERDLARRGQG